MDEDFRPVRNLKSVVYLIGTFRLDHQTHRYQRSETGSDFHISGELLHIVSSHAER